MEFRQCHRKPSMTEVGLWSVNSSCSTARFCIELKVGISVEWPRPRLQTWENMFFSDIEEFKKISTHLLRLSWSRAGYHRAKLLPAVSQGPGTRGNIIKRKVPQKAKGCSAFCRIKRCQGARANRKGRFPGAQLSRAKLARVLLH